MRLPSFVGGFVAGVAFCVAPAAFLLYHYTGASSWVWFLLFAWRSLWSPWSHALSLL